ncbi:uncharacterized protein LOC105423774 [Pogonomyrmex barbatus]|uniref:Uncharacterized protein LOC105423774 n=1 Tax=Pogonomyrmex barbatus TaxID=144034 RepID=A0A8N1S5H4_9HYME|nr:uncharacterized protein LOC105423774 [Pogonomyrmex barbatus]
MNLAAFKEIHIYEKNICPLRTLIDILQKSSSGRPSSILEITLLDKFPKTNDFVPIEQFSPRCIIEYMMKMHGNTMKKIAATPTYLDKLVYKYKVGSEEKEYVFSNNMMFYIDVIIICYLYFVRKRSDYKKFFPVIRLLRMMKIKYNIYDESNSVNTYMTYGNITWHRVALSYPSITFAIFDHNVISLPPYITLDRLNIPKIFYLPFAASIIPAIDKINISLALLLAMAIYGENDEYRCDEIFPLYNLYEYIFKLYNSTFFPKQLKLELCKQWGIIHVVGSQYKFAPYFKLAYEEAKELISTLKSNDPDLEYVISFI